MDKFIEFCTTHQDLLFKCGIGLIALICLIIIIAFIRKHKLASIIVILITALFGTFYFLNISMGFHFTKELSAGSIVRGFKASDYELIEDENYYIYEERAGLENSTISSNGNIFAVKKMAFFYIECEPSTSEYLVTIDVDGKNTEANLKVKEIKLAEDKYYYAFYLSYYNDGQDSSYESLIQVFSPEITIGANTCEISNYYFTTSKEKVTVDNLKVYGQSVRNIQEITETK